MRRLALAALAVSLIAPAIALAYPGATLTSTPTAITVGNLDCATNYEIRVREFRSGAWRDQLTYTKTTAACPTPTSTPTPTATPTATPPPPQTSSFPDASSTGVPAGTTLTAYTGPTTITTAGTVIDSKTTGCLNVKAAGVVIRNSRISCATSGVALYAEDGAYTGTPLLVEDSEINCQNNAGTGIGEALLTVRRVEITDCENGTDLNQDVLLEDSYIHGQASVGSDPHEDAVQIAWGRIVNGQVVEGAEDITIRHNTLYGINNDGSFGTSALIVNGTGKDHNILVQNNLMAGGAYTLYCERAGSAGLNFQVTDNHFSTAFKSTVGFYGISDDCAQETQSGNVIQETDQPITLQ